jgi:threonylcarbamoyladenosine tRNA methylthiotransferase MtaB
MKVAFLTYGCKANRYETELIRQSLLGTGMQEDEKADIYVINTCTVTGKIDSEILRKIKRLKSLGNCRIAVTGCLVERKDADLPDFSKYVDLIIPNSKKFDVSSYGIINSAAGADKNILKQFSGRDKAFVKVEDGCDNFCSYCEVPFVRGSKVKSRDEKEIIEEVKALGAAGFQEIVLTGINLGYFGRDKKDENALLSLLEKLVKIIGKGRLRLSSAGPREISNSLIDFMASSNGKICPHLHMSLQSGDAEVLRAMNRNYTLPEFMDKMAYALYRMPDMAITTDVIAGFPGETDGQHKNTCAFIEKNGFTRLHVFPYSDRPGTKAAQMPDKNTNETKKCRVKELIAIGANKEKEFAEYNIGVKRYVLAESGEKDGFVTGYTENYIKVYFKAQGDIIGKLVPVKIGKVEHGKAYAVIA